MNTKMLPRKVLLPICCCAASVLLSGCIQDTSDLDVYFESHRAKPARPISPIPEVKPYLRYVYPENEKDPFDVSMLEPNEVPVVDSGIEVDTTRVKEFLEGFPLDSLKMVGTVQKDNKLWALIKIPDGGVQSVRQGNYVGQNYGKIVSVSEAKLDLSEIVTNGLGGYKEQDNKLLLEQ
ncbi:pilus assembly protein PilP [Leucothrix mucor]|jgi:type IV pilus assembly protein PilP|uniref:pilus assembly protein PilP n=1 Tax=Leucothrix mucor TaxID=45248 RepID=UPI0003B63435|nr:pilus assembly protein PilP [Leucothrix mucor]